MTQKAQMGDIVEFAIGDPKAYSFKLRQQPMEVMKFLEDRLNPRYQWNDHSELEPPEDPPRWIVINHRDLFTPHGRRCRLVKICNLITNISGWVPGDSVKIIVSAEGE